MELYDFCSREIPSSTFTDEHIHECHCNIAFCIKYRVVVNGELTWLSCHRAVLDSHLHFFFPEKDLGALNQESNPSYSKVKMSE